MKDFRVSNDVSAEVHYLQSQLLEWDDLGQKRNVAKELLKEVNDLIEVREKALEKVLKDNNYSSVYEALTQEDAEHILGVPEIAELNSDLHKLREIKGILEE